MGRGCRCVWEGGGKWPLSPRAVGATRGAPASCRASVHPAGMQCPPPRTEASRMSSRGRGLSVLGPQRPQVGLRQHRICSRSGSRKFQTVYRRCIDPTCPWSAPGLPVLLCLPFLTRTPVIWIRAAPAGLVTVKLTSANTSRVPFEGLGPGFLCGALGHVRPLCYLGVGPVSPLWGAVLASAPRKVPADSAAPIRGLGRRQGHVLAAPGPWIGHRSQEGRWQLWCPRCPTPHVCFWGPYMCLCSVLCRSLPKAPRQQGLC